MSSCKYSKLNLNLKLEVIKDISAGMSLREVSAKYKVSKATASNINKKKGFYGNRALANDNLEMKQCNCMSGNSAVIDERLHCWFMEK